MIVLFYSCSSVLGENFFMLRCVKTIVNNWLIVREVIRPYFTHRYHIPSRNSRGIWKTIFRRRVALPGISVRFGDDKRRPSGWGGPVRGRWEPFSGAGGAGCPSATSIANEPRRHRHGAPANVVRQPTCAELVPDSGRLKLKADRAAGGWIGVAAAGVRRLMVLFDGWMWWLLRLGMMCRRIVCCRYLHKSDTACRDSL